MEKYPNLPEKISVERNGISIDYVLTERDKQVLKKDKDGVPLRDEQGNKVYEDGPPYWLLPVAFTKEEWECISAIIPLFQHLGRERLEKMLTIRLKTECQQATEDAFSKDLQRVDDDLVAEELASFEYATKGLKELQLDCLRLAAQILDCHTDMERANKIQEIRAARLLVEQKEEQLAARRAKKKQ